MPFVLQNRSTAQIFGCKLINKYNFEYHGVKFWEEQEEADAGRTAALMLAGIESDADWMIIEVEEEQLKLFNVKLNNNPARKLFLNEQGKPVIKP